MSGDVKRRFALEPARAAPALFGVFEEADPEASLSTLTLRI